MEILQVTPLGKVKVEKFDLFDKLDQDYKPGLYLQTEAFLTGNTKRLSTISNQVKFAKVCTEIASYSSY